MSSVAPWWATAGSPASRSETGVGGDRDRAAEGAHPGRQPQAGGAVRVRRDRLARTEAVHQHGQLRDDQSGGRGGDPPAGQPRPPVREPAAGQPVRAETHQAAGVAAHRQPREQRHREVRGQQVVDPAAAVDQGGVALDHQRGTAGDQHQGCPPYPEDQGAAGDAEHGQQVHGPELPERGVLQGVLAQQLEDVEHVPAAAGEPERERADPENRAVGQGGRPGEPPSRAERQRGEHRDPLGEPVLLGEERGREQQPGRDSAPGAAHPPRGVKGGGAERDEQGVNPGDVEPGVRDEIGRGQQARRRDPGGGARGLALHQPGQYREADQRRHQRHEPQRQVGQAEHAGRRGRGREVERRVAVRHVADGRRRVERMAGEYPLHLHERVALEVFQGEGVGEPEHGDDQVGGDRGQPEQGGPQSRGARGIPPAGRWGAGRCGLITRA